MSVTSTNSPVQNVSYDVLRDIFFHCLPENPLDQVQPNTNIAPILLCHVCSSWRAVALSSLSLWSHLHIRLPLLWDDDDQPKVRYPEALARDIEFMKWWRTNHGSMAPFLRFNLYRRSYRGSPFPPVDYIEPEEEDFLFDYMSTAQYLDVGIFYIYLIREGVDRGWPIATLSRLHTLVSDGYRLIGNDNPEDRYIYSVELPSHIPPTLRRLAIESEDIGKDYTNTLDKWSTLTHLSLNFVSLSVDTWFSLIRKLMNLKLGDFAVSFFDDAVDLPEPPQFTHSSLSTLNMSCHPIDGFQLPLSILFQNLKLPAIHTLALCSSDISWRNHRAIIEIHNVLKSAPEITKLIIGTYNHMGFLCFADNSGIPTVIDDTDKFLLTDAPHLMHLQVELRYKKPVDLAVLVRQFVQEFFVSNRWLDLASSTNTIQTITIAVENTIQANIRDFDDLMRDLLMWNIKKYVMTATDISFEVISAAHVGMVGDYGSVWKTWGSKV